MNHCIVALNRVFSLSATLLCIGLGLGVGVAGAANAQDKKPDAAKDAPAKTSKAAKAPEGAKAKQPAAKGPKKMKVGNMEFDVTNATLKTSMGTINLEFYLRTPASLLPGEKEADFAQTGNANVKGIMAAAEKGHYNGRIFHRVIDGFMLQLGLDQKLSNEKDNVVPAAKLESQNGLKNARGTVAMARTSDPNSATTQFFINLKDNTFLDYAPGNPGYTVVGKVVGGLDVVDKMAKVPTGNSGVHSDVPKTPILIESLTFDK